MISYLASVVPMTYIHAMGRLLRAFAFLAAGIALTTFPRGAHATVTTSTRLQVFTPAVPTNVFTITFPFLSKNDISVKHTLLAGSVVTPWISGVDYSIKVPIGSISGSITALKGPVGVEATLTVERIVPITQTTSFKTQGFYSAKSHEDSLDKLTMIAQQLTAAAGTDGSAAVVTHEGKLDPHSQYAILQGRAGSQHLKGGTGPSENLQLSSTLDPTKGFIIFGSAGNSVYNGSNGRFGFGTTNPSVALDVVGSSLISVQMSSPQLVGGAALSGDLTLMSTTHTTKGKILFGASAYNETNNRLGIGTATPTESLDVVGDIKSNGDLHLGASGGSTIFLNVNNGTLDISASTLKPGNNSAGITIHGITASLPNDLVLYGDPIQTRTESNVLTSEINSQNMLFHVPVSYQNFVALFSSSFTIDPIRHCNGTYISTVTGLVVSLPLSSASEAKGCVVRIQTSVAGHSITLDPPVPDKIVGSCVGDTGLGSATVRTMPGLPNQDISNGSAFANAGDYITVVSDGLFTWYVIGCMGSWTKV